MKYTMKDTPNLIEALHADRLYARDMGDPWASLCVLASVEGESARLRVLVLRDLPEGLALFYNTHSPKARQMRHQPHTELLTYYHSIQVQYRLQAELRPLPAGTINTHWPHRPAVSKQLDWLHERWPQGSPLDSSDSLDALLADTDSKAYPPPGASGALLQLLSIDRLRLRADGAHERHLFDVASGRLTSLIP